MSILLILRSTTERAEFWRRQQRGKATTAISSPHANSKNDRHHGDRSFELRTSHSSNSRAVSYAAAPASLADSLKCALRHQRLQMHHTRKKDA